MNHIIKSGQCFKHIAIDTQLIFHIPQATLEQVIFIPAVKQLRPEYSSVIITRIVFNVVCVMLPYT